DSCTAANSTATQSPRAIMVTAFVLAQLYASRLPRVQTVPARRLRSASGQPIFAKYRAARERNRQYATAAVKHDQAVPLEAGADALQVSQERDAGPYPQCRHIEQINRRAASLANNEQGPFPGQAGSSPLKHIGTGRPLQHVSAVAVSQQAPSLHGFRR